MHQIFFIRSKMVVLFKLLSKLGWLDFRGAMRKDSRTVWVVHESRPFGRRLQ